MALIDFDHFVDSALPLDRPDFDLSSYLANAGAPNDYNLREKMEQWRDEGVVVFENSVEPESIERFLQDIDFLCAHPKSFDVEIEFRGSRKRLGLLEGGALSDTGIKFNCLENISMAARELSLNRFICSFLRHVFQDDPCVLQTLTFWKGSNQPAHTDYPYVRTQTLLSHLAASWIPLEDIHEDSGPLAYYPGSHRPGLIRPFDWGGGSVVLESDSTRKPSELAPYLLEQIDRAGLKKKVFLPKKRDVLIWHGGVVHEGTQVKDPNRTRKSYVTHYTSRRAYPPLHKFPDAMEAKKYTQLNGGYVFEHPWVEMNRTLPSWSRLVA